MARPTANAKRESLPGCMSARPRAARHKAPTGLIGGNPGPQLDSSGSRAHQPRSTTAAIVAAANPAAWLACCLFRLSALPTNSVTSTPESQNRSRQALADLRSSLSGNVFNISACVNGAMPLQKILSKPEHSYTAGTSRGNETKEAPAIDHVPASNAGATRSSLLPEILEPVRRQGAVTDGACGFFLGVSLGCLRNGGPDIWSPASWMVARGKGRSRVRLVGNPRSSVGHLTTRQTLPTAPTGCEAASEARRTATCATCPRRAHRYAEWFALIERYHANRQMGSGTRWKWG